MKQREQNVCWTVWVFRVETRLVTRPYLSVPPGEPARAVSQTVQVLPFIPGSVGPLLHPVALPHVAPHRTGPLRQPGSALVEGFTATALGQHFRRDLCGRPKRSGLQFRTGEVVGTKVPDGWVHCHGWLSRQPRFSLLALVPRFLEACQQWAVLRETCPGSHIPYPGNQRPGNRHGLQREPIQFTFRGFTDAFIKSVLQLIIHTFTKTTAESTTKGDSQLVRSRDRTNNLLVTSQPALPPELGLRFNAENVRLLV